MVPVVMCSLDLLGCVAMEESKPVEVPVMLSGQNGASASSRPEQSDMSSARFAVALEPVSAESFEDYGGCTPSDFMEPLLARWVEIKNKTESVDAIGPLHLDVINQHATDGVVLFAVDWDNGEGMSGTLNLEAVHISAGASKTIAVDLSEAASKVHSYAGRAHVRLSFHLSDTMERIAATVTDPIFFFRTDNVDIGTVRYMGEIALTENANAGSLAAELDVNGETGGQGVILTRVESALNAKGDE